MEEHDGSANWKEMKIYLYFRLCLWIQPVLEPLETVELFVHQSEMNLLFHDHWSLCSGSVLPPHSWPPFSVALALVLCADSGAAHALLPDPEAFVSQYRFLSSAVHCPTSISNNCQSQAIMRYNYETTGTDRSIGIRGIKFTMKDNDLLMSPFVRQLLL